MSRKRMLSAVIFAAKLAATGLAFWLILRSIDIFAAWQVMRRASVADLGLAFVFLLAQVCVNGLRWSLVANYSGIRLHPVDGMFRLWESTFFGQLTPSGVGSDAWRIYALRSYRAEIGPAMNTVIFDRLIGVAVLVLIVLGAFGTEVLLGDQIDIGEVAAGCGLALVLIFGVIVLLVIKKLPERDRKWDRFRLIAIGRTVSVLFGDALRKPGLMMSTILLSVVGHVFCAMAAWTLARAVGFDPGPLIFFAVVPLALLIAMVPITIAGWGLREGVLAAGFVRAGASLETAAAISLLFGLGLAAIGITGGIRLWLGRRKRTPLDRPSEEQPSNSPGTS